MQICNLHTVENFYDSHNDPYRITDRMEGCVNKVSLFDKDLMFVVIFGFRGFKHELDSQIGLRCATECFHEINALNNVKSTSIGVTTGTYHEFNILGIKQ